MIAQSPSEVRRALLSAGYFPLPACGKEPSLQGWPDIVPTLADISRWGSAATSIYELNTGVLNAVTPFIDVDVDDDEVAQQIEDYIRGWVKAGIILVRYGRVPRRAIAFQAATTFKVTGTPHFVDPQGRKHHVEFRCDGCQTIVDGLHPDTQQPYVWEPQPLWKVQRKDLPLLDEASALRMRDDIVKILRRNAGWKQISKDKPKPTISQRAVSNIPILVAKVAKAGQRERAYGATALKNASDELAGAAIGERNALLNTKAFAMGRQAAAERVGRDEAKTELLAACQSNGLINDDGLRAAEKTFDSGFAAGMEKPAPPLGGEAPRQQHNHKQAANGGGVTILDRKDPMRSARELAATRFTDDRQRRLLHWHRDTYWLFQNGRYRCADDYIRAATWQFLEMAKLDDKGEPPFKPTSRNISDVVDALTSVCYLDGRINPPTWLNDADDPPSALELLPVGNGLLHLPTTELIPLTPDYFNIAASDVQFDPEAREPAQWLSFLKQLFGDDEQAITTLQDWFGYTLSPDTSQQKMLMIVGPPRSGKGTIGRINTALLGGYDSVATPTLAGLQTTFGLEPLIGKMLGVISDARLSGRTDQAIIIERLLSLSGEDGVEAARKFKKAWTGRLPIRFTLLTNELPKLTDSSSALAKRFVILMLAQSFYGREDPLLTARLLTELPGILNWALVGYQRLRERGYFVQPESGRKAVEQLELLSSPVTAFVNDQCEIGAGHTIRTDLLYQSWRIWCEANGKREPGTSQSFGRDLAAAFPAIETTNPKRGQGGSRHRYYEGIRLRPKEQEEML